MPWFRGQRDCSKPPIPHIFRKNHKGKNGYFDEFWLSTTFRNRAPSFGETPENRDDIDKWLFLMRHMGLPTRLLDWSESAMVSLFMATSVNEEDKNPTNPAVWMINPVALNNISLEINEELDEAILKENHDVFPNTWVSGKRALENIRLAFKHPNDIIYGVSPTVLPLAIQLTYCHPRMSAQKGCFTLYGINEGNFEELFNLNHVLVEKGFFKKYIFDKEQKDDIYCELQKLGVTYSTVFPDLIGLSKELTDRFFYLRDKPEKPAFNPALNIQTETIEASTYQGLNLSYQKFLENKMKESDFYGIEKMNFWKENNTFIYYVSYMLKTN